MKGRNADGDMVDMKLCNNCKSIVMFKNGKCSKCGNVGSSPVPGIKSANPKTINPNDGLAHFEVCSCGKHGRIVFPDSRTGGEMASKNGAMVLLQYAMLVDKFQGVNIFPQGKLNHIADEIDASTLADSLDDEVDGYFAKQINTWNTGKLHQPSINPADFHKVMDRLYNYNAFEP